MTMRRMAFLVAALALVAAACGGGDESSDTTSGPAGPGDAVAGAAVYSGTCAACHGPDLQGIDGLGKQLVPNEFVATNTEDELVAFLLVGRAADDPLNTQGVEMPARGGNPSLTDQDLHDVAAYLQAQQ